MTVDTAKLKKMAQAARRQLGALVAGRLQAVLKTDSSELRGKEKALAALKNQIHKTSETEVIERVAYIWFNRFCALRFMDANRYNRILVVTPPEGFTQPEILAEAKQGYIDDATQSHLNPEEVSGLLNGRLPSKDPQNEAFRLLLVATCNEFAVSMPYLFGRIDEYTELLMPEDLLSESSVLHGIRATLTDEMCEDVEVIGWLYQFYISEKKDEVFDGLKKNKKITPENIPAATQLFTPHWIVRYLVENSLGRLWMLNRPTSTLINRMDYYIAPQENETDFLKIDKPEDLKICDPACGSGHMLVYAFDLLYTIYEEEGMDPVEIPEKILTHNLYGIEIDERAGELAAFALTMKARAKQRRFLKKKVHPKICVLKNIRFDDSELKEYMDFVGEDLFTTGLRTTLRQFEEADNFGSLIRPAVTNVPFLISYLEEKDVAGHLFLSQTHQGVLQVLKQADFLSPIYHVVIANPPYMGGKGMNPRLGAWIKDHYPDVKSDLFSAFIVRNTELTLPKGQLGFMSPFVWMFISSYEKLRSFLINRKTITSLVQLEYSGFDGATVPICTFTVENEHRPHFKGGYVRLSDFRGSEKQGPKTLEAIKNPDCGWFYRASSTDFSKIPGSPIAYWVPNFDIFISDKIVNKWISGGRIKTHDGQRYIRFIWEPAISNSRWKRLIKGGDYRKHFGNENYLVDWSDDAVAFYEKHGGLYPEKYREKEGICWSKITSATQSFRIKRSATEYDSASPTIFNADFKCDHFVLALLNSSVSQFLLKAINPTLNTQVTDVMAVPVCHVSEKDKSGIGEVEKQLINISLSDWDSYETSWDFTNMPLLQPEDHQPTLKSTYEKLCAHWQEKTQEMQRLEEENNRIFINAYGLQDELTPEVPLKEITLTRNPHYRYNGNKTEEELAALLLADTMKEFISYGVGCMFGRYSLDKPGLILANQGETFEDYLAQVPDSVFPADDDNVIPMLDGDWFVDDITERFRKFLRITFGDEHFEENLAFMEAALGKEIKKYFLKDFYTDHVKRYKKRPIYWLFSSPKGSFNALIYMHRYRPDTVSMVLNEYLREFRTKLDARMDNLKRVEASSNASKTEKTRAIKEMVKLKKMINEIEEYEHDLLYPLATQKVEIDLDDGVTINYNKFGAALKKVTGLTGKG
jgi:type II restriction/modification system DNA methylase subunit YeeA